MTTDMPFQTTTHPRGRVRGRRRWRRRRLHPTAAAPQTSLLTALLLLGATAGVGVVGGIAIQKHWGGTSSSAGALASGRFPAAASGLNGARVAGGSGAATPAATGPGGFAASGTAGTVKAIDGTAFYVTDFQGNVVKVTTDAASTVSVTKAGAVKDVKPGDTVVVQGTQTKTGYRATSISVGGAGGLGRFGRGGGAGFGGAAGAGGSSTETPSGFGGDTQTPSGFGR